MPTYGYRCQTCDAEFDVWQRMSDEPGAACPDCGGAGRRMIFPVGIVFKGSGFYKTDSRGGSAMATAGTTAERSTDTATAGKDPVEKAPVEKASTSTAATGADAGSGGAAAAGGDGAGTSTSRDATGSGERSAAKRPRQSGSAA